MPNQGMLRGSGVRGGGLRAQRQEVDTGRGEPRVTQGRSEHQGRGTFVNFYEDLGISAVEPAAQQLRTEETDFQGKVKERQGQIAGYKNQYQGALGQVAASRAQIETANKQLQEASRSLPDLNSAVNQSWNQYKSSRPLLGLSTGTT